jgi:NAD(P)-dependent dehydrogenase (short-subunit alcohol dehydrogenase family)
MRLKAKLAIASGAASGMGAATATARRFAKEGATVVIADMLEEEGWEVAAEITRTNGTAEFMRWGRDQRGNWKVVVDATSW